MLTLFVPRAIPVTLGVLGVLWGVPTTVTLLAGGLVSPLFSVLNMLIGLGLISFAIATARIRVRLDDQSVTIRTMRRTSSAALADIKGLALLQDGGVPRLRVVTRSEPLQVAAWSLRARDDVDGEIEPAGIALERFGAAHGIRVKVRQLTGPVVD